MQPVWTQVIISINFKTQVVILVLFYKNLYVPILCVFTLFIYCIPFLNQFFSVYIVDIT